VPPFPSGIRTEGGRGGLDFLSQARIEVVKNGFKARMKETDPMKETEKTRKTRNREHKGKREEKAGGSWKPVKPLPVIAFFLKKV
jgi:hypothetical protein